MILVTGATGNAGSQVVRALGERGAAVRAFVRDAEMARVLFGDGVELAVGDFADPASVEAALEGVADVMLSCADDPRRVAWEARAIDAAASAGVRRIVKLSTIGAEPGAPVAFWDWHGRVEQHLRASGVAFVILQSTFYMSNLLAAAAQVAREGRLYAPAHEARIAMIDPRDVGAAAAAVLTSAGHEGKTYVLTGPEAITYEDIARELSRATGAPVEYIDVPEEAARRGLVASGMPDWLVEHLVGAFRRIRAGDFADVTGTVEELTGRPARAFAEFAYDYRALFARDPAAV